MSISVIYKELNDMWTKSALTLLLTSIVWINYSFYPALSQQFDSRINNLEFDLNRLESRINQIELQLSQTRPLTSPRNRNNTPSPPTKRPISQSERDKMFDRLATLVIELKQDIRKLDQRVSQLESR